MPSLAGFLCQHWGSRLFCATSQTLLAVFLFWDFPFLGRCQDSASGVDDFLSGLSAAETSRTGRAPHLTQGSLDQLRATEYANPTAIEIQHERLALQVEVTHLPWSPPPISGPPPTPTPQSMQWHAQATAILQRSQRWLGPDHIETNQARQLLAEILTRQHRGDAAAPIWRQCIGFWDAHPGALGGGNSSIDCERGLGLALLEYPHAKVVFSDEFMDAALPLSDQVWFRPVYSDQTTKAQSSLRVTVQMYSAMADLPGYEHKAATLRGECQTWASAARAVFQADRSRAYSAWYSDFRTRYLHAARQQYRELAELIVAMPPGGNCYHMPACTTLGDPLRSGRGILGQSLQVAVRTRAPCSVCNPPTELDLDDYRTIQFDGQTIDLRTIR